MDRTLSVVRVLRENTSLDSPGLRADMSLGSPGFKIRFNSWFSKF